MFKNCLLICIFLTRSTASNVTLTPGPTIDVIVNNAAEFTCTTTRSWKFIKFYDEVHGSNLLALIRVDDGTCTVYTLQSNYISTCISNSGPFKITIKSVTRGYHNKNFTCTVQYGNNKDVDVESASTRIKVEVLLEQVDLFPKGEIILREDSEMDFQCNATSLPRASIRWLIGESSAESTQIVDTSSNDTTISSFKYRSQREDDGKTLFCIANNGKVTVSANVSLIIQYRPTVTASSAHNPYKVIENMTDIQLTCRVTEANPPVLSYKWYKDGLEITNESVYTISTVEKSADGLYTCDATNSAGTSEISTPVDLIVLYGVVVNPIYQQNVSEGRKLSVNCTASSNPAITDNDVVWTKINSSRFEETGQELNIRNITRLDGGTYTCTVAITLTSSTGHTVTVRGSTNVKVEVLYRPTVRISPDYNIYNVTENNKIQLTCEVIEAKPVDLQFRWYKNNLPINGNKEYTIENLNRYHAGNYTCQAENSVGNSTKSSTVQLNVLYGPGKPSVTAMPPLPWLVGTRTQINCSFSEGNPLAKVRWSIPDVHTHIFIFESLRKDQNGLGVSCTVSNKYSNLTSQELKLDVHYTPDVILEATRVVTREGQNISTKCIVDGNPAPTVQWLRDGKLLTQETVIQSTLLLEDVSRNETGKYTCLAQSNSTHGILTNTEQIDVDVHYAPDVAVTYHTPELAWEGNELNLLCNASGRPSNYTFLGWTQHRENTLIRTISSGNLLNITKISYQDLGNYSCSVTNGVEDRSGRLIRTATIDIIFQFKPAFVQYKNAITAKVAKPLLVTVDLITHPDIYQPVVWINATDDMPVINDTSVFMSSIKTTVNASFHGIVTAEERYGYQLFLRMERFESHQAGVYTVVVNNSFSVNNVSVLVILSDVPSSPLEFAVSAISSIMVSVTWISGSSGGNPQTFIITYGKLEDNDRLSFNVSEKHDTKRYYETIYNLSPSTMYIISIDAMNSEGFAVSMNNTIHVETLGKTGESSSIIGPVGGAIGGIVFAGLLSIVIVMVLRRRPGRTKENERSHLTRSLKYDRENDELKDNILYESAGPNLTAKPEGCGTIYAVVNKLAEKDSKRKGDIAETRIHAEVHTDVRNTSTENSNVKMKMKMKDTVVKNGHDDVYENLSESPIKGNPKNVNKDGLVYAELVFNNISGKGRKFLIHGMENKTNYADIDLNLKAGPLSSDDSDNEESSTKVATKDAE